MMASGGGTLSPRSYQAVNTQLRNEAFKVVIVGASAVGKTSLLKRYCDGSYSENGKATIGTDFFHKTILLGQSIADVMFWDTAGQELFSRVVSSYYRGAQGLICAVDLSRPETLETVESFIEDFDAANARVITRKMDGDLTTPNGQDAPLDMPVLFVGTKSDLAKSSSRECDEAIRRMARKYHATYMRVSAKEDINVTDALDAFCLSMYESVQREKAEKRRLTIVDQKYAQIADTRRQSLIESYASSRNSGSFARRLHGSKIAPTSEVIELPPEKHTTSESTLCVVDRRSGTLIVPRELSPEEEQEKRCCAIS